MITDQNHSACRLCGSRSVGARFRPREMMFGTRRTFDYFRCADCGCLQLNEVPADLAEFYPPNYYSFQQTPARPANWPERFKRRWFHPAMTRHILQRNHLTGHLLCHLVAHPPVPGWLRFLVRPLKFDDAVLDVGCGLGGNLLMMRDSGFTNLQGVDPFITRSLCHEGGVHVDKCELSAVGEKFDLIMFHHVFEHLVAPLDTLKQACQRLAPGGQMLIRIPLADSFAAQKYGEHWVQLDAPRHIALPTRKAMEQAARQSGLKITRVVYDSNEFQFWASEQYRRDIPLFDARSDHAHSAKSIFSPEEMDSFRRQAEQLNQQEAGDQAAFILEAA